MLDRMLEGKLIKLWIGIGFLLGFIGMLLPYHHEWIRYLAAAWAFCFALIWLWTNAKQQRKRLEKLKHQANLELIETLHHYRHDWMNDVQVLFGYIKLKKFERLLPYIEGMKEQLITESALSRLGVSALIVYLVTFRTHNRNINFAVNSTLGDKLEVSQDFSELLSRLIITVLESFRASSVDRPGEPNQLILHIEELDGQLSLSFEFTGSYEAHVLEEKLNRAANLLNLPVVPVLEKDFSPSEADVFVRIPIAN